VQAAPDALDEVTCRQEAVATAGEGDEGRAGGERNGAPCDVGRQGGGAADFVGLGCYGGRKGSCTKERLEKGAKKRN
jgi:hypothetical protein